MVICDFYLIFLVAGFPANVRRDKRCGPKWKAENEEDGQCDPKGVMFFVVLFTYIHRIRP